jgi:hypothetical protein
MEFDYSSSCEEAAKHLGILHFVVHHALFWRLQYIWTGVLTSGGGLAISLFVGLTGLEGEKG